MLQSRSAAVFAAVLLIKTVLIVAVNAASLLPLKLPLEIQNRSAEDAIRIIAAALLLALGIFVFCGSYSGSARFFLCTAKSGRAGLKNFFSDFRPSVILKSTALYLSVLALRLLFFAASFLPSAVMAAVLINTSGDGLPAETAAIMFGFGLLMLCVSALFFGRMSSLLFLAPYLFSQSEGIFESIKESMTIMSRNLLQYKRMKRSFYGWFALCVLVLPVPFVWGYYRQSAALFANCLICNYRLDRENKE